MPCRRGARVDRPSWTSGSNGGGSTRDSRRGPGCRSGRRSGRSRPSRAAPSSPTTSGAPPGVSAACGGAAGGEHPPLRRLGRLAQRVRRSRAGRIDGICSQSATLDQGVELASPDHGLACRRRDGGALGIGSSATFPALWAVIRLHLDRLDEYNHGALLDVGALLDAAPRRRCPASGEVEVSPLAPPPPLAALAAARADRGAAPSAAASDCLAADLDLEALAGDLDEVVALDLSARPRPSPASAGERLQPLPCPRSGRGRVSASAHCSRP